VHEIPAIPDFVSQSKAKFGLIRQTFVLLFVQHECVAVPWLLCRLPQGSSRLPMLFREIVTVCSTNQINTFCGRSAEFLKREAGGTYMYHYTLKR